MNHKRVYRLYRNNRLSLRLREAAPQRQRCQSRTPTCGTGSEQDVVNEFCLGRLVRRSTITHADRGRCLHPRGASDRRRSGHQGRAGGRSDGTDLVDPRRAHDHSRGQWTGVHLEGSRPLGVRERRHAGLQPTDNAFVESFNGRLRDECLNAHWFLSVANARAKIEAWRRDYSESRPHTSLGWITPVEYAAAAVKIAAE